MATSAAPRPARPQRAERLLSVEIAELRERSALHPLTLRAILKAFHGRAYLMLLMLLALPFIQPIPVPGLSTLFGAVIAFISLRLALGQRPWLPKRWQRRQIPQGFFDRVLGAAQGVIRFLEKFTRPRLALLVEPPLFQRLHALAMLISALILLLPMPIPFSNTFPAWVILLMSAGLLARDGAAIVAAYSVGAGGVVFFVFLGETMRRLFEHARAWLFS